MESLVLLATEASHHEAGFGLNFDILETNLINLVIIIGVLFYFGRSLVGKILSERRSVIEQAIEEAEKRQKDAEAALAVQQQKLTQAQIEADRIRAEAEARAKEAKDAILAKSMLDVEQMRANAVNELDSERDRAIAQLRSMVATMAMERVENQLKTILDESAQSQLVDKSIALLGGKSK